MARFRGGKSVNRNPHVPLALVRRKKDVVDFSEVRFVVALRISSAGSERTLYHISGGFQINGLWRCLAAVVKALHSIHCEAPPKIGLQKSKHKV